METLKKKKIMKCEYEVVNKFRKVCMYIDSQIEVETMKYSRY